jgi:hypothetical protein
MQGDDERVAAVTRIALEIVRGKPDQFEFAVQGLFRR